MQLFSRNSHFKRFFEFYCEFDFCAIWFFVFKTVEFVQHFHISYRNQIKLIEIANSLLSTVVIHRRIFPTWDGNSRNSTRRKRCRRNGPIVYIAFEFQFETKLIIIIHQWFIQIVQSTAVVCIYSIINYLIPGAVQWGAQLMGEIQTIYRAGVDFLAESCTLHFHSNSNQKHFKFSISNQNYN